MKDYKKLKVPRPKKTNWILIFLIIFFMVCIVYGSIIFYNKYNPIMNVDENKSYTLNSSIFLFNITFSETCYYNTSGKLSPCLAVTDEQGTIIILNHRRLYDIIVNCNHEVLHNYITRLSDEEEHNLIYQIDDKVKLPVCEELKKIILLKVTK